MNEAQKEEDLLSQATQQQIPPRDLVLWILALTGNNFMLETFTSFFNFCFSFENSNPNTEKRPRRGHLQWDHQLRQVSTAAAL